MYRNFFQSFLGDDHVEKAQMNEQWKKLVRMQHPEKFLKFARQLDEKTLAAIYRMDLESYLKVKEELRQKAKEAAKELLVDQSFAEKVDHLPFKAGETVMGVGESTTDDLLSWFEILRHLLEQRRPQDKIRMINEGISGDTTTNLLGRINGIVAQGPDWIICMIGNNDALRYGPESTKTQVSVEENGKNISEIHRMITRQNSIRQVWMTPTLISEEKVDAFPYFKGQLTCRNEDIQMLADAIHRLSDPVIDTQAIFEGSTATEWMEIDGLHPTIEGHQAIVSELVEELTVKDKN